MRAALMHENRKRMDQRMRDLEVVKICRVCRTSYTREQWKALEYHDTQDFDGDGGPPLKLEYRHCPCRNTLVVELDRHGEIVVDLTDV